MDEPKRIPELRPEIVFVFDLVRQLLAGSIRIPRFQRPFVWRRDQMLDLLDSINRQYPIGSLLAWESDAPLVSLDSIGPIAIKLDSGSSATYLLDGHQRLSTIAGALVSNADRSVSDSDDPARWNIYYNAYDNSFEHLELDTRPEAHHFPMSKILDTFEFIEECKRVLDADPELGRVYVDRIQDVARAFQNYKIPVIQIRQTDLSEAVEIFARLNSRGQAMTSDQMVSAMLYREGDARPFDLAAEISETISLLALNGFGGVDRTVVLRALLAAAGEDIYRTDWTRIARNRRESLLEKFRVLLPEVNESFERAANYLRVELGIAHDRLLPYSMQLVVVSSFFFAERDPSEAQLDLMRQWFWVSSFGMWFGNANPSRINVLVKDVMENVAGNRSDPHFASFNLEMPAASLPVSFDMRSARTRAMLLALIDLAPLDRNGFPLDVEAMVEDFGPSALAYVSAAVEDSSLARGPANRIFRDDVHDRNQAKNWLQTVDPSIRESVWNSHAIGLESLRNLERGDVDGFLRDRLARIAAVERQFMSTRGVVLPSDGYGSHS